MFQLATDSDNLVEILDVWHNDTCVSSALQSFHLSQSHRSHSSPPDLWLVGQALSFATWYRATKTSGQLDFSSWTHVIRCGSQVGRDWIK